MGFLLFEKANSLKKKDLKELPTLNGAEKRFAIPLAGSRLR
jgi:hypothetical protein